MSARYYKDREGCSSTFQTERKSTMAVSKPLLLLDNASMLALLHQGCFRLQEISFEEVKAILEMHGSREVVRCFSNAEIEQLLYKHLDVAIRNFNYAPVENMAVDQDAIPIVKAPTSVLEKAFDLRRYAVTYAAPYRNSRNIAKCTNSG